MTFKDLVCRFLVFTLLISNISWGWSSGSFWERNFTEYMNDQDNLLYCPQFPNTGLDDIEQLSEHISLKSCFKDKKSYLEYDRELTADENRLLLLTDVKICDCLADKAKENTSLDSILKRASVPRVDLSKVTDQIEKNYKKASLERGKLLFDASLFCGTDSRCSGAYFQQNSSNTPGAPQPPPPIATFMQDHEEDTRNELREVYQKMQDSNKLKQIDLEADAFSKRLLEGEGFQPGQCVSGREFISFKQKESFQNIFSELSRTNLENFKEDEWNFRKLRAQYDSLMALGPEDKRSKHEDIKALKNKLIFLDYNPLIKTFLSVEPRPGSRSQWFSDIPNKKRELLSTLKSYVGSSSSSGCTETVIGEDKMKKFNNDLMNFFIDPLVSVTIKFQSNKLQRDMIFKRQHTALPLTQEAVVTSFIEEYKDNRNENQVLNPDNCTGAKVDELNCPIIYGGYCKKIEKIRGRLFLEINDDVPDDLDSILANSFNPDINTNPAFKKFNDDICNTKFETTKNVSETFNEYKEANCKNSNVDECKMKFFSKRVKNPPVYVTHYSTFIRNSGIGSNTISYDEVSKSSGVENIISFRSDRNLSRISTDALAEYREYFSNGKDSTSDSSIIVPHDELGDSKNVGNTQLLPDLNQFSFTPDYSGLSAPNSTDDKSGGEKIENMNDEKKKQLLSDWEKEYEDWRKSKNVTDTNQLSPADVSRDESYKKEIQTLKSLLDDQIKLSKEQSKLLNEALARRAEDSNSSPQKSKSKSEDSSSLTNTFGQIHRSSNGHNSATSDIARNPSSFTDASKIVNSSGPSSATRNSSVLGKSLRSSENSDSLAREQAKLVNIRNFADGSIMVDSGPNSAPNAITLPVSDEQYRQLLVDPSRLSLGQIEKSIPADQISKLEKSGEIILLLKNGSNPPFEVRVERKDKRLVYRLKDKNGNEQKPVRRIFTLKALESNLRE